MSEIKTYLSLILAGIVLLALIFAPFVGFDVLLNYNSCKRYESMGIPVDWDFWGGCMANHPEFGWLPINDYFQTLNLNVPDGE